MIAARLKQFLNWHKVDYDVLCYDKTLTLRSALDEFGIPYAQCATTVGLSDAKGVVIVVLPFAATLDLFRLNARFKREFSALSLSTVDNIFMDCQSAEHPAIAEPYGVSTIIDTAFAQQSHVYMRSGASHVLLGLSRDNFRYLTANQCWKRIASIPEELVC